MDDIPNHTEQQPVRNNFVDKWWLMLLASSAFVMTSILYGIAYLETRIDLTYVLYPLVTNLRWLSWPLLILSCLWVPTVILIILVAMLDKDTRHGRNVVAFMLTVVAVVFACQGTFANLGSNAPNHIDSAVLSGYTFNLASYQKFGDIGETYLLYQCSPENYCTLIHKDFDYYADNQPTNAHLQINQEANTLDFVINGKTIYTYTPE